MFRISPSARERLSWGQICLGLALTTLATLLLELALTRVFSVVFYYHFAFLAISIALFGLGAGGILSYAVARTSAQTPARLGLLAACAAAATILALLFLLSRRELSAGSLTLMYFATALPFTCAGCVVSLVLAATVERVHRIYFYDLLGAALGCLFLAPLLNTIGGPNTILAAALLFAASSAVWFNIARHTAGRVAAVSLALALTLLIAVNTQRNWIDVRYAKGRDLHGEIFVKWNSFSRVALAPERPSGMMTIFIDADASTGIARFNLDRLSPAERRDLLHQGPAFPYRLRPGGKTLIIGPGGGWDVARAIASGSRDITGVEINPIIATTIMRQRFPALSNYLYFRPEVRILVEDGRTFVRRSPEKYDILQATLVDTWASTAAGAYALSESSLYTTEAFYDYLSHLSDRGLLSFTRWGFDPPRESLRLIVLARQALARLGESNPAGHFLVVREGGQRELQGWGARDTVVISRKPLSTGDLQLARQILADSGLSAVYLPDQSAPNAFWRYLHETNPQRFLERYPFDVSPVNDDRPFFFYTVQSRDILRFLDSSRRAADFKINAAVPMLFGVLGVSFAATFVVLVLPALLFRDRIPTHLPVLRFLSYFAAIGAGYILIQVALIQHFVIFLGNPTYSLTVTVFSMLLASGLGSYLSGRLFPTHSDRLRRVLLLIPLLVGLLAVLAPLLITHGIAWPRPAKLIVCALLISPAAFLMGMPFPAGLRLMDSLAPAALRWAWALNAACSVLGSALAVFLAIHFGFRTTLFTGATLYLLALLAVVTLQAGKKIQQPLPVAT